MIRNANSYFYPEIDFAGFARNEHRFIFYSLVRSILQNDSMVLDFGAGRGKWVEIESGYLLKQTTLKGDCKKVVGCDVDPEVKLNKLVDEAIVIEPGASLPFPDSTFDLIVSWAVLEHIENPESIAAELTRVLKPGGMICAWTPNKWGYVGIGARMIPNSWHAFVFSKLVMLGGRHEKDIFPTVYHMNTIGAIRRYFPDDKYENFSSIFNGPPSYTGNRLFLAHVWRFWAWLLPDKFGQMLYVFLRKRNGD